MITRICRIGLLLLIGGHWSVPALSQERHESAEATDLRRVEIRQSDAQGDDAVSKIAADTSQISPGTKKSFTQRISSSGCGVPGGSYDVDADTPNFINFIDKGVSFDILNNQFILKFEIEVDASAAAGYHDVKLTYRFSASGGVLLCTRELDLVINTNPVPAPTADFSGSPRSGAKPLTVQFTDASSGQITSRSWSFGDGQSSTATNPSHTYLSAGAYTVSLRVTGPGGSNTKTRSDYVTVAEPAPVADFSGSPTSGTKPLTAQFTDATSGLINSRSWNFGDGQTSAETNPSHTYLDAGVYTVSLTVTGPGGSNTRTRSNYITVQEVVLAAPRNLTAQSGVARRVPLQWESPDIAASDTIELFYDDGTSESLLRGNFSGAELAVRFTPSFYPVSLTTVGFLAQGDVTNDAYGVKVYLDPAASNAGPIGSPVVSGEVSFSSGGFILADFPSPITIESGDFYIALNYISGTTQDFAIGMDEDSDALRSWIKSGGTFSLARDLSPEFAGNLVVRALVTRTPSSNSVVVAAEPSAIGPQDELPRARYGQAVHQIVPTQNESENVRSSSVDYSVLKNGLQRGASILPPAHGRSVASISALLDYNIYRSLTSPVVVVSQNRIGNTDATQFEDTNVSAGATYHYAVTAVYDEGESAPSNEASATPGSDNHPPVVANAIPHTVLQIGGAPFMQYLNDPPVVFTDADGDALSYAAGSSNSAIAGAAITGSVLTVSPVTAGSATITITASDGKGGAASAAFTVQVNPANPQTPGTQKWVFTAEGEIKSSPAIGSGGVIYVGSLDNMLYAINPNGAQKWAFATDGPIHSSPAIGSDGTIYLGSVDGKLYAINPSGTQKWVFTAEGDIYSSPAIAADGTVYFGSDGTLYAIDANGTKKWAYDQAGGNAPVIGEDGTIYTADGFGFELHAVNPDGTQKWIFDSEEFIMAESPAIGADGTIYLGSGDNHLNAINPDGTRKWTFDAGGSIYSSAAVGTDGVVYVGSQDGTLLAINPDSTKKWSFSTKSYSVDSSPAIGADGTVYVGADDGKLYAINPDGSQKWAFSTERSISSSPAIGADGAVYFGNDDNKLYAVYGTPGGLSSFPWPKFRGTSQNLGRFTPPATDVGVTAIDIPSTIKLGDSVRVSVTIKNFGTTSQSSFQVNYQINSQTPVKEVFSASLPANASAAKAFAVRWTAASLGNSTITARTMLTGDQRSGNDAATTTFPVIAINDIGVSRIELPVAAGLGVPTTIRAVVRNFGANGRSSFSASYQIDSDTPVAESFSQAIPPNDSVHIVFATPWLPQARGAHQVAVRTSLIGDQEPDNDATSQSVPVTYTDDVGIAASNIPAKSGLAYPVTIRAQIRNYGSNPQSEFPVSYQVNNDPPVTENFPGSLLPLQTEIMVFSSKWTPGALGNYQITLRSNLNNDRDASNDASHTEVEIISAVYAGTWNGRTTDNRPISFHVNEADIVDTLSVEILISIVVLPYTYTCSYVLESTASASIQNGVFEIPVSARSGTFYSTKVRGTFSTPTSCQGKVDGFDAVAVYCGGGLAIGQIPAGGENWTADGILVAVPEHSADTPPSSYSLSQNYPNPFNPGTVIEYSLPKASHVELKVYDLLGREVQTLVNERQDAGRHRAHFEKRGLPTGIYFYRLRAGEFVETRRMTVVR